MAENGINANSFHTQYSEIFGQWPWKNPQGENQSERVYYFFKIDIHLQSKSNLSQPADCLIFCAYAASISVQSFSRKTCQKPATTQPRYLCRMSKIMPLIFVPISAENPYSTDSIKYCCTP